MVAVPGPGGLASVAPAGLLVVAHALAVRPGPTVVFRDPAAPEASTAARTDRPVAGAAVPPAGWDVPPWLVPWRDLEGLEQRV